MLNFLTKYKESIVISILILGFFLITNSIDGYNLSKTDMRELNLGFIIIFLAFYYKDKPWPKKEDFIAFGIAILMVVIMIAIETIFD